MKAIYDGPHRVRVRHTNHSAQETTQRYPANRRALRGYGVPSFGAVSIGFHSSIVSSPHQGSVEIIYHNHRPPFRLRSFLCLVQCSLPLLSGAVLCLGLRKDSVGNLEVTMRWAMEIDGVPGTVKLFLRWGLADWANGSRHESALAEAQG